MEPFREKQLPHVGEGDLKAWAQGLRSKLLLAVFPAIERMPFNRSEAATVSDSGSADTEFSVTHHLGRVPEGYLITKIDKGGVVYDSGTTWTTTTVYLKCSAANAAISLRIF